MFTILLCKIVRFPSVKPYENVGAANGRPENIPLTNLGMMVKQVMYDIPITTPCKNPSAFAEGFAWGG